MGKYNGLLEKIEATSDVENDLKNLIFESRNATDHKNCIILLKKAYLLTKTITKKTIVSETLKIEILTDLAKEVLLPSKKLFYWQKALNKGFAILNNTEPEFVD